MKSSLGRPSPIPYVVEDDLVDLAGDLGPGIFPSSEVYDWHVSMLKDVGREPVSKKKFGTALKEAGWVGSSRYLGGKVVRCWMITKPWARRGAEKLKTAGTDPAGEKGQP